MARLGALAELDLDHLDLRIARIGPKFFGVEGAIVIAATEIARGHLPDQVAAVFAVVHRDRTVTGVMRKASALGTGIERADGIGAERAKTHGRDIEHASTLWLRGIGPDGDAKVMRSQRAGRHRMRHPFMSGGMGIELGAEGPFVRITLGTLIDQRTLRA